MNHPFRRSPSSVLSRVNALGSGLMLAACASQAPAPMLYDFGLLSAMPNRGQEVAEIAAPTPTSTPALAMFDPTGPAWLDSPKMAYRLSYAEPQQSRFYAFSQWNATPLQLLGARLKSRIAQAGVTVLPGLEMAASANLLRLEVDDFSQQFDTPKHASGHIALRASLFRQHRLIGQKSFESTNNASSADAIGGAKALAVAADTIAAELITWINWINSVPAAP